MKVGRLTDKHPLFKKIEKLDAFMRELGVEIEWDGYHLNAHDTESGFTARFKEDESGSDISSFPCLTETKLVVELEKSNLINR